VIEASGCVRLGVDLGGTKIEIAALDAADNERLRRRVLSPRDDYDATVRAVRDLVAAAEAELGETASVGIGTPGAISPATGLVKNANSTWLNGRPLHRDLAAALSREIRIANDADCFALSEAADGAGADARTVFGVILGTGVGGGIVRDGALLSGPNAIAGELGHNPLPWPEPGEWPGPPCYCGRTGCTETFLSGPGLSADHVRAGGADLPPAEIATRATRGDLAAPVTMTRYADRLARALAAVINLLDPDVIVLGGGLSNLDALYTSVPPLWPRFVFSDTVATRLVRNRHGDSSGVRGAARRWPAPT
jgi:fructokinase